MSRRYQSIPPTIFEASSSCVEEGADEPSDGVHTPISEKEGRELMEARKLRHIPPTLNRPTTVGARAGNYLRYSVSSLGLSRTSDFL